jgi:two-component system invasion response regulator UvrY
MKILIADDHTIVREGIIMLLREEYPDAEIVDVSNAAGLLDKVMGESWDIVISDISMPPGDSGLDALQKIRKKYPALPVIILSMHSADHYAVKAMRAGASAYLTKSGVSMELLTAVHAVLGGRKYITAETAEAMAAAVETGNEERTIEVLSEREKEVFLRLARGQSVSEIAEELQLSTNTVSTFRVRIFEKLGFHNNLELIKYAIDNFLM